MGVSTDNMAQTTRSLQVSRGIAVLSGGIAIVLGSLVLMGWDTHTFALVRVRPVLAPVQPNTALLFVLTGVGLLSFVAQRPRLTIATASAITGVSALTLLEYLFAVDLGLDQLLLTNTIITGVSHPGRMALNTALGFSLIGIALLLLGQSVLKELRPPSGTEHTSSNVATHLPLGAGMLGSLVAALGVVSSFGYLSSPETVYEWSQLTRMSPVTAVGLLVLGVGIVAGSWQKSDNDIDKTSRWFSPLLGVCLATVTLLLWQIVGAREQVHLRQAIHEELYGTRKLLGAELESRLLGLVRMAKRCEYASSPEEAAWEADANLYLQHYPGYSGIAWVDAAFRVKWLVPLAGKDVKNVDLSQEERRRTLLETARDQRRVVVSPILDLLKGGKGFLIAAPIFVENELAGVILGVFRIQKIFDVILEQADREDFTYALFDGKEEIYRSAPLEGQEEEHWGQETALNFHDVAWRLRLWPRRQMLTGASSAVPEVILLVGFLVTGLCMGIVQLEQSTRRQAREVDSINQSLYGEIRVRREVEEALRAREDMYRSLIEQSADAIFITDAQANFLMVNARTCVMTGYSREELLQMNVSDLLFAEDLAQAPLRLNDLHAGGDNVVQMDRRVRRKDGTLFYVESRSKALADGNRQAIVRDITERKRMEETLRESEERFRRAFEDAAIGMALVAPDGRFLRINQSLSQIVGYTERELLAITFQAITHPDDLEADLALMRQMLTGEISTYQMEKRYIHKRGHIIWILLSVSLVRTPSGEPLYFVSQIQDITSRKQMEEMLRRSEERLALALRGTQDILWDWDLVTNDVYYSSHHKALLGSPEGRVPLSSERWISYLHPDDCEKTTQAMHDHLAHKGPYDVEYRLRTKTGKYRWFHSRGEAVWDAAGNPIRMAGSIRDITERKQTEEALREGEERFRRAFDDAAIGMALVDPDGRFLRVNQSLCAMLGYEEHELLATTFQATTHPDDLKNNLQYTRQMLAGERNTYQLEKRYLHKNGDSVWILLGVSLVRDASGAPLYFVSQIQDITIRKRMEKELRASQERFQAFMDNSPAVAFIKDENGRYLYANKMFEQRFRDRFDWRDMADAELWSTELVQQLRENDLKVLTNDGPAEFTEMIPEADGPHPWLSIKFPIQGASGQKLLAGIAIDMMKQKQLEEMLTKQAQELARSNVDLQQFASVASHDLQEPLRKVQTFVDLFLTDYAQTLDPQGRDYLERIAQAAGRMRSLIKDLLMLSRVSTKGQPFVSVDLTQVVREVEVDLETRIQESGGRVEVGELPILEADPTQMHQLLQNLISNALKFHRKEEPPLVKVYRQHQPGAEPSLETRRCCIVVEDNGIGFDEKYLERIFQPFQRLHGRQEYEGTGMGLAICRKIVERHEGQLTAKSAPGRGSTFVITLPLRREPTTRRAA